MSDSQIPKKSIEIIVCLAGSDDARLTFVSDTFFDGVSTPEEAGLPEAGGNTNDFWTIHSLEELAKAMDPVDGFAIKTQPQCLFVDIEALSGNLSQVLIGLGALCSRWAGGRLIVTVPKEKPDNYLSPLCDLLRSLEARAKGVRIISCPTCARCHTDLVGLTKELEGEIKKHGATLDVALMGCEVNGPGEAKAADVGVAFGKGIGIIFRNGEIIKRLPEAEAGKALLDEVEALARAKAD